MSSRYLIITSRFNSLVTDSLRKGAETHLLANGVSQNEIDHLDAPGCFELPLLAQKAAGSGAYKSVICLGAVIRGETPHFDYVAGQAASGIMHAGLKTNTPIVFGVLTTDTVEQALNRSGLKNGNKGIEAATAALESLRSINQLEQLIK